MLHGGVKGDSSNTLTVYDGGGFYIAWELDHGSAAGNGAENGVVELASLVGGLVEVGYVHGHDGFLSCGGFVCPRRF